MLLEEKKERLTKELNEIRAKLKEDIGHLRKLRKEIRLSVKRLERKAKLPGEQNAKIDQIDIMILTQFLQTYLNIINRSGENIREGLEELKRTGKEEEGR